MTTADWYDDKLTIKSPRTLPATIDCRRTQLGGLGAYKPNVVRLSDGELLLANFHAHYEPHDDGSVSEHVMLYRSADEGASWQGTHCDQILGHEPYLNVFSDDTLITTSHHPVAEVRNTRGRSVSILHRSTDRGQTWSRFILDSDSLPIDCEKTHTSRTLIELDDGTLLMGLGCGYGKDYTLRSSDRGQTWQTAPALIEGYNREQYRFSPFEEGVFWRGAKGELFMLARCAPEFMRFTEPLDGLPEFDYTSAGGFDHFDVEILFQSLDEGQSFQPVRALNLVCCMYPSVLALADGRTMLTFTVREPVGSNHMGVQSIFVDQAGGDRPTFTLDADRIVIDEKTPDCLQSGGGFGNTVQLSDGRLLSTYSYYHADDDVLQDMQDGSYLADEARFEATRRKAAEFYTWADGFNYQSLQDRNERARIHCYLGCCQVLGKAGPKTEVTVWPLPESAANTSKGDRP